MIRDWLLAGALLTVPPTPATANDTTAHLAAGGLVLVRNDAVEMESEDLHISRSRVQVHYVFRNTSGKDVTLRVAFPMPPIGGPGFFMQDVSIPVDAPANFLGFATKVDGKPVRSEIEQRAFVGDTERTAWLTANRVPLAPHREEARAALDNLPAARRAEAVRLGLIDEDGEPAWALRVTYHWQQHFPAGVPVVVEHGYTPSVGATVGTMLGEAGGDPETAARYCVDPPLRNTLRAASRAGRHYYEQWVDYVLVTGGNWKKPIGRFRLVVDKEAPADLVSFCGEGVRKIGPTQFEMTKINWRPDKDLSILFLSRR